MPLAQLHVKQGAALRCGKFVIRNRFAIQAFAPRRYGAPAIGR
jgi:hypothetical protein